MKRTRAAILAATLVFGCSGGEGDGQAPGDGGSDTSDPSESSADDVASERNPTPDVSTDAASGDRFVDIFDVFPLPDGPLGGCVTCIRDRCGAGVNECANNDVCRAGLLCTLMTCVASAGDGGPDIACVTGCFMGDFRAVLTAVGSYSCINMSCGAACFPAGAIEGGAPGDDGSVDTGAFDDADGSVDGGSSIDAGVADAGPGD